MPEHLATWSARARAQIIDVLIISVAAAFAVLVAGGGSADEISRTSLSIIAAVGSLTYNVVLLARGGTANGQTVGKHAMGIRVVRTDGAPLTFADSLRRELLGRSLPSVIPFYIALDVLWPLNDPQRQAIHDKIAGTLVVLAHVPVVPPEPPRPSESLETDVDLGGFLPPSPPRGE